jgi:hypothetical protein
MTAVDQAIAFTLRALQTPPRDAKWRTEALGKLKTWNFVVQEIEDAIPYDEVPPSEYHPTQEDRQGYNPATNPIPASEEKN